MKVLLINGSPHPTGCTYTALSEVARSLNADGIETDTVCTGQTKGGCMGCGYCRKAGKCVNDSDMVNKILPTLPDYDGFVFGTPVHYASASGAANMRYKPGAVVASARRAGTTAALDQLTKYLTINNMPVVSSGYWNMVHGNTPEEVYRDEEGVRIMRQLGHNMAWLMKCLACGKENGIPMPIQEPPAKTNFIR